MYSVYVQLAEINVLRYCLPIHCANHLRNPSHRLNFISSFPSSCSRCPNRRKVKCRTKVNLLSEKIAKSSTRVVHRGGIMWTLDNMDTKQWVIGCNHNLDYARSTNWVVRWYLSIRTRGAHIPIHLVAMAGLSETFCACVVRNQKTMFASQREMESIYIDWYCVIDSANIDDGSDENTNNIHLTSHILIQWNALHMDVRVCVCVGKACAKRPLMCRFCNNVNYDANKKWW